MTTTAKDLIVRAFARRTAFDPDKLASRKELVRALSDYLRGLYVEVAEVDEEFFETSSAVTGVAGVWAIPATMISVFLVLNADGDPVSIVPVRDTDADIAPRVYRLGNNLRTVGEDDDPGATDVLTLYGSALHSALDPDVAWDNAANTLDATWPERHNEVLIRELARLLAFKGGLGEDAAQLAGERDQAKALLLGEAELRAGVRSTRSG